MKQIILIVILSAAHYTVSKLTPSMTLLLMDSGMRDTFGAGLLIKALVLTTKLLYFPLLTFSLYSRQWFPGGWINIIIVVNSLIWGGGIFFFVALFRKLRNPL